MISTENIAQKLRPNQGFKGLLQIQDQDDNGYPWSFWIGDSQLSLK